MPYHDLHLAYGGASQHAELSHTLAFAAELGYSVVAVAVAVGGKLPSTTPVVPASVLSKPNNLTLLTRLTLIVSDTSQNHRLSALQSQYDLLALRPTNDKSFQLCCSSLECDLISLDLSQRLPFILKFKTISAAQQRGIRFEICYSPGISGGADAMRNVISGATSLIRATRGRGLILSSEAKNALGLRGPHDVMNLAHIWSLGQERGKEALCEEAGRLVMLAKLKRETYRGVVSVIKEPSLATSPSGNMTKATVDAEGIDRADMESGAGKEVKRKASSTSLNASIETVSAEASLSKREQKRRAKKARMEAQQTANDVARNGVKSINTFPIKHESMTVPTKKKR